MSDCTAFMEKGILMDKCKKCGKHYCVRNDDKNIWNPATEIPVGKAAYSDVPLCSNCRRKLTFLISKFIKK